MLAPMRAGGLERVVSMLSAGQMAGGAHVAAILDSREAGDHPFVKRLESAGTPVTAIPVAPRDYRAEYSALRSVIARLRPQVVHTHGSRADIIGGVAARRGGARHVSTVHGFTGGGMRNRTYELLQRFALRHAHGVIAVSAPIAERLRVAGVSPRRIHVVPNGFVSTAIPLDRASARARLGLKPDQSIIGWIGRLSKEKGADVMLEALALLDPVWRLSIVGEGPELGALKSHAERLGLIGRVTWHGPVEDAAAVIRAFDAFVLSSRTEGTPIVLFEAMEAGVPIVATRVGGVPNVINAEHAIMVDTENPRQIADAVEGLGSDSRGAVARSERARRRLHDAFGYSSWLSAVDGVYASLE